MNSPKKLEKVQAIAKKTCEKVQRTPKIRTESSSDPL